MIIGEAPGFHEDQSGQPFVGRSGKLLDKMLEAMNLSREEVYICNVIKCRPPENRDPTPDEIEKCKPYLTAQIQTVRPKLILLTGLVASKRYLKNDKLKLKDIRGEWQYSPDFPDIKAMPIYHPAAMLRNSTLKVPTWKDLQKAMECLKEE